MATLRSSSVSETSFKSQNPFLGCLALIFIFLVLVQYSTTTDSTFNPSSMPSSRLSATQTLVPAAHSSSSNMNFHPAGKSPNSHKSSSSSVSSSSLLLLLLLGNLKPVNMKFQVGPTPFQIELVSCCSYRVESSNFHYPTCRPPLVLLVLFNEELRTLLITRMIIFSTSTFLLALFFYDL